MLRAVGPEGRVWSMDSSAAMLDVARRHVDAPNVRFATAPAESFHLAVDNEVDAVVCNSAFWQTDNVQVLGSARRALRSRGRFAFNLGEEFFKWDDEPEDGQYANSPQYDRMVQIAVDDYGYTLPSVRRFGGSQLRNFAEWKQFLTDNGFTVARHEVAPLESTAESFAEWLRVPVFAGRMLPGLPYDVKIAIYERAREDVPEESSETRRWIHFVCERR